MHIEEREIKIANNLQKSVMRRFATQDCTSKVQGDAWVREHQSRWVVPVIFGCVLNDQDLSSLCQQGIGAEANLAGVGPAMGRQRATGGDRRPP